MTVKELAEFLLGCDPNADIVLEGHPVIVVQARYGGPVVLAVQPKEEPE